MMKMLKNSKSAFSHPSTMTTRLDFRRLNKILPMLITQIEQSDFSKADISKQWHCMHIMSCSQLIKPEAEKRGLLMELAAITAALHDYGLLITGRKENHAKQGAALIGDFLDSYNTLFGESRGIITQKERKIITYAVLHHSEKEIDSGEPYTELLKDIDCLDRYLHGVPTGGAYLKRAEHILHNMKGEGNSG